MSSETRLEDEVPEEKLAAYRAKLASARGRVKPRPDGPVRTDIEKMKSMMDLPDGGDVQLTGDEIRELARTPDPSKLSVPGAKPILSPETVAGLAALEKANTPDEAPDEPEDGGLGEDEEVAAMQNLLGSRKSGKTTQVLSIYDAKRRALTEAELSKIDIALVLTNQDVVQRVSLAPGADVTYRSLSGIESEFVPRYIWERYRGELTYEMNELAKSLVSLTLSVIAVSGRDLPEHRTKNGSVDTSSFEQKWWALLKYPAFLLEAMDINRIWFIERCALSLKVADVGNG